MAAGRIVGDAVESEARVVVGEVVGSKHGGIEGADDRAGHGVDHDDGVGEPHVGQHLTVHALQFVEMLLGFTVQGDLDGGGSGERVDISHREGRRAVAHHELGSVVTQPPTLAVVGPAAGFGQRDRRANGLAAHGEYHAAPYAGRRAAACAPSRRSQRL